MLDDTRKFRFKILIDPLYIAEILTVGQITVFREHTYGIRKVAGAIQCVLQTKGVKPVFRFQQVKFRHLDGAFAIGAYVADDEFNSQVIVSACILKGHLELVFLTRLLFPSMRQFRWLS